jgi:hypothetical protein
MVGAQRAMSQPKPPEAVEIAGFIEFQTKITLNTFLRKVLTMY